MKCFNFVTNNKKYDRLHNRREEASRVRRRAFGIQAANKSFWEHGFHEARSFMKKLLCYIGIHFFEIYKIYIGSASKPLAEFRRKCKCCGKEQRLAYPEKYHPRKFVWLDLDKKSWNIGWRWACKENSTFLYMLRLIYKDFVRFLIMFRMLWN